MPAGAVDFEDGIARGADRQFGQKKIALVEAATAGSGPAESGRPGAEHYGAAAAGGGYCRVAVTCCFKNDCTSICICLVADSMAAKTMAAE